MSVKFFLQEFRIYELPNLSFTNTQKKPLPQLSRRGSFVLLIISFLIELIQQGICRLEL